MVDWWMADQLRGLVKWERWRPSGFSANQFVSIPATAFPWTQAAGFTPSNFSKVGY